MLEEITGCSKTAQDTLYRRTPTNLIHGKLIKLSQKSCFFRAVTFKERQKPEFNQLIEAAASEEQKDIAIKRNSKHSSQPSCFFHDTTEKPDLIEDAEQPLQKHMLSFLTIHDLNNLSKTNRFFRAITFEKRQLSAFNYLITRAALGEEKDINVIIDMIKANPSLLLERGNVITRGGTRIIKTTVYEFFLGSGHTQALKRMSKTNLFALLDPEDKEVGERKRIDQSQKYRSDIKRLRDDVKKYDDYHQAKNSTDGLNYPLSDNLEPLINVLITASNDDVSAERNNQPGRFETELCENMRRFRDFINCSQHSREVGIMHYAHYTMIMQVLDLLGEKEHELTQSYREFDKNKLDKCRLVFSQIFGYLELVGLPDTDRCAFAHAFKDEELSLECRPNHRCRFDDLDSSKWGTALGFEYGIIGGQSSFLTFQAVRACAQAFKLHIKRKLDTLEAYAGDTTPQFSELTQVKGNRK